MSAPASSGAYSAWRLKQKYPQKRVALFEYSNRVGGRLYSTPLPGMPNINAELGGMRYIPDSQTFVRELIENMGLPTRDFPMGAPDDPGGMNNLMYLRRRLHARAGPHQPRHGALPDEPHGAGHEPRPAPGVRHGLARAPTPRS